VSIHSLVSLYNHGFMQPILFVILQAVFFPAHLACCSFQ
jgi:hypothetical protein